MAFIKKIQNYILRRTSYISTIESGKGQQKPIVFLTFDDGPEEGITEFVVDELKKYDYHGTFFCRGDNAEKYPQLLSLLRERGHSIGNHTYSHFHAYETSTSVYVEDVYKADAILKTKLLRPPYGSLTIWKYIKLKKRFKIFFWSLNSEDSDLDHFNLVHAMETLKTNTKDGVIVLFHFCHRHERETRQLLPEYLLWLHQHGYQCEAIKYEY